MVCKYSISKNVNLCLIKETAEKNSILLNKVNVNASKVTSRSEFFRKAIISVRLLSLRMSREHYRSVFWVKMRSCWFCRGRHSLVSSVQSRNIYKLIMMSPKIMQLSSHPLSSSLSSLNSNKSYPMMIRKPVRSYGVFLTPMGMVFYHLLRLIKVYKLHCLSYLS